MQQSLGEWRRAKKISQEKLGKEAGVSANTIRQWERTPEIIPIGKAIKIANFIGIDLDDIIFLSNL